MHSLRPSLLPRFIADQAGTILILAGFGFLFLVGVAGAGYDLGYQQLVRQKIQQASDAAALAAAAMDNGTSNATRQATAQAFFALNYPANYLGIPRPTPNISISADGRISVSATANVRTAFVSNFGITNLAARGASVTGLDTSLSASDYDVVMVVDESGSTAVTCPNCGGLTRIEVEKNAISAMINSILPAGANNPNVRFGLVGYTQYISNKWGLSSNRDHAFEAVAAVTSRLANYDHFGMSAGANMVSGITDASVPSGVTSTAGLPSIDVVGIITPRAVNNNNVPPPRTARSDGATTSRGKNLVLLTDGEIMVEPAGCTFGTDFYGEPPIPGAPCPNYPAFLAACTNAKNAGATVFTISFASQSPADISALSACASIDPATGNPRYFFAPDADTLMRVLQSVGSSIRKVRIVQ